MLNCNPGAQHKFSFHLYVQKYCPQCSNIVDQCSFSTIVLVNIPISYHKYMKVKILIIFERTTIHWSYASPKFCVSFFCLEAITPTSSYSLFLSVPPFRRGWSANWTSGAVMCVTIQPHTPSLLTYVHRHTNSHIQTGSSTQNTGVLGYKDTERKNEGRERWTEARQGKFICITHFNNKEIQNALNKTRY